jgi:hypothetical protein
MPPEALAAPTKFQARFDELSATLKANRKEILGYKRKLDGCFARMLRPLRDMETAFRQKPPKSVLCDGDVAYGDFDAWMVAFVEPITGFKKRQAYYALHISKNLVDKITDDDLEVMGIEKAKVLSRFAETKGKVPKEMVERAKTGTLRALEVEVKAEIYRGNPDHEERSAWETLEIEGPRTFTSTIRNFLQLLRRQEGHKPSDAELLALAIGIQYEELKEAALAQRSEVSGLPGPTLGRSA